MRLTIWQQPDTVLSDYHGLAQPPDRTTRGVLITATRSEHLAKETQGGRDQEHTLCPSQYPCTLELKLALL